MSDERDWQHPAERAANDSPGFIMNPPPLGRRLAMLTATVSVIASIAILIVAVPKGVDEYVDEPEPTTTLSIVKGAISDDYAVVSTSSGKTCGINVSNGQWIVAADEIHSGTDAWIETSGGERAQATIARSSDLPALAVVRSKTSTASNASQNLMTLVKAHEVHKYSVIDCISREKMSLQVTPSVQQSSVSVPVYVNGEINGIGAVVDEDNKLVGLVYEHNHAERLLEGETFLAFMKSVGNR